jgi:hypothetical protein
LQPINHKSRVHAHCQRHLRTAFDWQRRKSQVRVLGEPELLRQDRMMKLSVIGLRSRPSQRPQELCFSFDANLASSSSEPLTQDLYKSDTFIKCEDSNLETDYNISKIIEELCQITISRGIFLVWGCQRFPLVEVSPPPPDADPIKS